MEIPPVKIVKVESLKVDGENPNRMSDRQHEALKKSIMRYGFIVPIITNKDFLVADGEQRLFVAKELGMETVPVVCLPVADVDRRLLRQILNKLRGEHVFGEDAREFDLIVKAGEENSLKDLLLLDETKLNKYLQESEETKLKSQGLPNLKDVKILNLYAGIGGNRKFWGELDITAVEYNKEIAACYQEFYPTDTVIVDDAHKYLEQHFNEYDFIWSSPPCPTHSKMRKNFGNNKPVYPDMRLYEEILFLKGYFEGKWIVENVQSWYEPLIQPRIVGRHYFWSNFEISSFDVPKEIHSIERFGDINCSLNNYAKKLGIEKPEIIPNLSNYPKDKIIRNMIHPLLGEHILNCAFLDKTVEKINV